MKKIITLLLTLLMICCLSACSFSASSTTTTTTTTTNDDGSQTTTTTTTTSSIYPEGSCGALAEDGEDHYVMVSFINNTDEDINEIYLGSEDDENRTALLDGVVLNAGGSLENWAEVNYDINYLTVGLGVDFASQDETIEFEEIDFSDVDAEGFTIELNHGDSGYSWSIDAQYVK